jgi:hypothetical protein
MKSLFAWSKLLLHQKWHVFADASTAYRFPGMCMAGLAIALTYLFGARTFSRRAGLIGALLLGLMPRVFYDGHLACFDMAIAAMWTLTLYLYWRSLESRHFLAWALTIGVVYGLTLETKHNAWILPAVVLPHAWFIHRREMADEPRLARLRVVTIFAAMALVGPVVFVACWPWLWHDTLARIREYASFHLHHEYYNMEFLGVNYFGPPSPLGYMPVMILATVPTVTILLFSIGAWDRLRWNARRVIRPPSASPPSALPAEQSETDLLFALAFLAAIGPFVLPRTPIFGGTKHWLPAYPFLALFAGRGFEVVAEAMRRALSSFGTARERLFEVALGLSVTVAPAAITVHSHPYGLSSYVPFVGGTRGGASLGLNRQFWGFTTQSANAEFLAENAPPGAPVFIHDTAWDSWIRMIDENRVRRDLRGVRTISESSFALVHHELHMNEVDYQIWVAYGTDAPVYVVTHDGVPIVSIYKRP